MSLIARIVFSAVVLFSLLALVLFLNTFRFVSRQIQVEPAPNVELDERQMARRLAEALRFKTVSYRQTSDFDREEFLGLHAFLEETFPQIHSVLRKEVIGKYSLLYTWPGRDRTDWSRDYAEIVRFFIQQIRNSTGQ